MLKDKLVNITPDVRLLRVLRNTGFDNLTAHGELIDNAIDSGASNIDIYLQELTNKNLNITIVDNGKGMTEDILAYALTLAKELKHGIDQLGKYGMGLKTAFLSMTLQMDIFTKSTNGNVIFGEFNINKMEKLGEFKTLVREATPVEVDFFKQKIDNSQAGTVIVLKDCDRIAVSRAETLKRHLTTYVGLTYRNYIKRGIVFTISITHKRGDIIRPIDPLMREYSGTIIVRNRETYPINYPINGKVRTSFIEMTAVVLPKAEKQGKYVEGIEVPLVINQANQGLYFLRENRQVASAITWDSVLWERHPSKNRFRIEIVVKSELDDEIRMNFQKGNVDPTTHFKKQLGEILSNILKEMKGIVEDRYSSTSLEKQPLVKKFDSNSQKGKEGQLVSSLHPTTHSKMINNEDIKLESKSEEKENLLFNEYKEVLNDARKIHEVLKAYETPYFIKQTIINILDIDNIQIDKVLKKPKSI